MYCTCPTHDRAFPYYQLCQRIDAGLAAVLQPPKTIDVINNIPTWTTRDMKVTLEVDGNAQPTAIVVRHDHSLRLDLPHIQVVLHNGTRLPVRVLDD